MRKYEVHELHNYNNFSPAKTGNQQYHYHGDVCKSFNRIETHLITIFM